VSKRKTDSNRRNAQKSTGPKTPAGKAISRTNAFKHGLAASHPVLIELEDHAEFNQHLDALTEEFQPVGIMEQMLVAQIADAYWRRQRVIECEVGIFDLVRLTVEKNIEGVFSKM